MYLIGEAGVIVPRDGYLRKASNLCHQYNALLIVDEIQTGLCRTGRMICCDHEGVRPDVLLLGKALSGGLLPVSAVLCDDYIMNCLKPGEHGSTYGGNPLACKVAIEALRVLVDERLAENACSQGKLFTATVETMRSRFSWIEAVRGRGLLNAIVIKKDSPISAWDACLKLKDFGVLCKSTHGNIIRFAPPLTITSTQMVASLALIQDAFTELDRSLVSPS